MHSGKFETEEVTSDVFEKDGLPRRFGWFAGTGPSKIHKNYLTFNLTKNPLVIVMEAVEKPGNLGAVCVQPMPLR
ncbi:MAG: hypothetical protein R2764_17625 [Bacteroidales bacterium]